MPYEIPAQKWLGSDVWTHLQTQNHHKFDEGQYFNAWTETKVSNNWWTDYVHPEATLLIKLCFKSRPGVGSVREAGAVLHTLNLWMRNNF
jgi:hypothetical protein